MSEKTNNHEEKEKIIISLDISTATTGVCVLEIESGDLVKLDHVSMNKMKKKMPVYPDFWSKVDCMEEYFKNLLKELKEYNICAIAVEESAKRFTPGQSSADTLFTLAKFNILLQYILYKETGLKSVEVNVRSGRKKIGISIDYKDKSKSTKQKVLEQVVSRHPEFPWVYKEQKGIKSLTKINEDRADAFVIAEATRKNLH